MTGRGLRTADRAATGEASAPSARPAVRLLAALAVVPPLRLAVARYAVPPGSADRTGCDGCGAPIGLDRPVPALGPAARCPGCRARVGAAPGAVELALVAALAVLALAGGSVAELAATAWWLAWAVPLALVDAAVHRLPDRLSYPAAAGTWALLGLAALTGPGPAPWLRATLAGSGLALGFAATTLLLGRRGFGLGDAKLALSVGALLGWYGWPVLLAGLVLAFALSALVALTLLATRRVRWSSHLPFGPFLIIATPLTLLLTP
ncbi:leader peptidase (prepilin peptidase)/N-methyltransferase [Micromonospora kangleipakensis]|uniref:Leader peptidase (Prepilin peptidase)/N-methyltransferase n=1 Tax=Micromonospora kangleipakensis TaxID=1077942 RepID=A0A4Q8B6K3_9ACTN|nr:A24 family peptidase [Micromonospora kangleipakensis]RZU72691.1 leader peptidase (prepilin peptidase)/N-methyltransferase [Micromonospora kangleipakensis]